MTHRDEGLCRPMNENSLKEYVSGFYPKEESELVAAGYEYIVDGWYAALRLVFSNSFAFDMTHII